MQHACWPSPLLLAQRDRPHLEQRDRGVHVWRNTLILQPWRRQSTHATCLWLDQSLATASRPWPAWPSQAPRPRPRVAPLWGDSGGEKNPSRRRPPQPLPRTSLLPETELADDGGGGDFAASPWKGSGSRGGGLLGEATLARRRAAVAGVGWRLRLCGRRSAGGCRPRHWGCLGGRQCQI
jgi:hypothetical protein